MTKTRTKRTVLRAGRPKMIGGTTEGVSLSVWVSPDTRERVIAAAGARGLAVGAYIRALIVAQVGPDEKKIAP